MAKSFREAHLEALPLLKARFPRQDPTLIWVSARSGDRFFELRPDGIDDQFLPFAYDLASDPEKRKNLFDKRTPDHRAMQQALEAYRAELITGFEDARAAGVLPVDDVTRRLRSLGYID